MTRPQRNSLHAEQTATVLIESIRWRIDETEHLGAGGGLAFIQVQDAGHDTVRHRLESERLH